MDRIAFVMDETRFIVRICADREVEVVPPAVCETPCCSLRGECRG